MTKQVLKTHFISPGRPHEVTNCSQSNSTADAIFISCSPGYDGGLTQLFTLELYRRGKGKENEPELVRNITSSSASFFVRHVEAGSVYDARVYSR